MGRILGIVICIGERMWRNFIKRRYIFFAQAYKVENMSGGGGVDGEVDCRRRQGSGDLPRLFFFGGETSACSSYQGEPGGKLLVKHHIELLFHS